MKRTPTPLRFAPHARALFVREFFASAKTVERSRRDAIRAVTLFDAEASELTFSMDDFRDVCLRNMREALEALSDADLAEPLALRLRAVEACLAVLHQRPPRRGRSVSSVLASTVLADWRKPEILRIAALLFETGLLRDSAQDDGAVWFSPKRDRLRLHAPTALRLFPTVDLDDDAAPDVRAPDPKR